MIDDMMNLRSLVEKSADTDFLRDMIGFAAGKLMALEVGTKTGAGYAEAPNICHAAIKGRKPAEEARQLFVQAAQDVGMLPRCLDNGEVGWPRVSQ